MILINRTGTKLKPIQSIIQMITAKGGYFYFNNQDELCLAQPWVLKNRYETELSLALFGGHQLPASLYQICHTPDQQLENGPREYTAADLIAVLNQEFLEYLNSYDELSDVTIADDFKFFRFEPDRGVYGLTITFPKVKEIYDVLFTLSRLDRVGGIARSMKVFHHEIHQFCQRQRVLADKSLELQVAIIGSYLQLKYRTKEAAGAVYERALQNKQEPFDVMIDNTDVLTAYAFAFNCGGTFSGLSIHVSTDDVTSSNAAVFNKVTLANQQMADLLHQNNGLCETLNKVFESLLFLEYFPTGYQRSDFIAELVDKFGDISNLNRTYENMSAQDALAVISPLFVHSGPDIFKRSVDVPLATPNAPSKDVVTDAFGELYLAGIVESIEDYHEKLEFLFGSMNDAQVNLAGQSLDQAVSYLTALLCPGDASNTTMQDISDYCREAETAEEYYADDINEIKDGIKMLVSRNKKHNIDATEFYDWLFKHFESSLDKLVDAFKACEGTVPVCNLAQERYLPAFLERHNQIAAPTQVFMVSGFGVFDSADASDHSADASDHSAAAEVFKSAFKPM